jgi:DNA-binding MltR family transcriptional regulator
MGLISESMFHDLNIMRKIRNKFAHQMHGYTFDEPAIVSWCNSLKLAKMITDVTSMPKSHGNHFILGVTQLAMWLGMKIIETEKSKKSSPKNPKLAQAVKVE